MSDLTKWLADEFTQEEEQQAIQTQQTAAQNIAERSEFTRGLLSGVDNLQATGHGFLGAMRKLTGDELGAQRSFEGYQEQMREAAENPRTVQKFFSADPKQGAFGSVENLGTWAAGTVGEFLPSLTEMALTSAAGAAIGSQVVPGIGPDDVVAIPAGAIGGLFSRGAIKTALAKMAAQHVAKGVGHKTARELAKRQIRNHLAQRSGAFLGTTIAGTAMEGGGMYGELKERGIDAPVSSLALGLVSGLSESAFGVTPKINKIFSGAVRSKVADLGKRGLTRRAAGALWDSVGTEAGQEGFQEFLGSLNQEINDPEFRIATKEQFMNWAEASASGGLAGGLFGGASSTGRGLRRLAAKTAERSQNAPVDMIDEGTLQPFSDSTTETEQQHGLDEGAETPQEPVDMATGQTVEPAPASPESTEEAEGLEFVPPESDVDDILFGLEAEQPTQQPAQQPIPPETPPIPPQAIAPGVEVETIAELPIEPELAAPQVEPEGLEPLGMDRPTVFDESLRQLSDSEFEAQRRETFEALDKIEEQFDETPNLIDDPNFRKNMAQAQDRYSAYEAEEYRRRIQGLDAEFVVYEIEDMVPSDEMKGTILAQEIAQHPESEEIQRRLERILLDPSQRDKAEVMISKIKRLQEMKPAPAEEIAPEITVEAEPVEALPEIAPFEDVPKVEAEIAPETPPIPPQAVEPAPAEPEVDTDIDQVEGAAQAVETAGIEHEGDGRTDVTTGVDIATARKDLLKLVDDAIEDIVSSKPEKQQVVLRAAVRKKTIPKGMKTVPHSRRSKPYVFEVPGDGTFKITPNLYVLFEFAKRVKSQFKKTEVDKKRLPTLGRLPEADVKAAERGEVVTGEEAPFKTTAILDALATFRKVERLTRADAREELGADLVKYLEKEKLITIGRFDKLVLTNKGNRLLEALRPEIAEREAAERERKSKEHLAALKAEREGKKPKKAAVIKKKAKEVKAKREAPSAEEITREVEPEREPARAERPGPEGVRVRDVKKDRREKAPEGERVTKAKKAEPSKLEKEDGDERKRRKELQPQPARPTRKADRDVEGLRRDAARDDEPGVPPVRKAQQRREEVLAPEEKPGKRPVSRKGEVADFGEKLGGARKDMTPSVDRDLSDDDIAKQPLSKIWPKTEIDAIDDKDMAALAHTLRSSIPAKPRNKYKLQRWAQQVNAVRDFIRFARDNGYDPSLDRLREKKTILGGLVAKVQLLQTIDRKDWGRIGEVSHNPDAYTYQKGQRVPAPYASAVVDGKRVVIREKAIEPLFAEVKKQLEGDERKVSKLKFEVRGSKASGYGINRKGDPLYRKLKTFETSKEALEFKRNNHDALVAAWEDIKKLHNVKETDVRTKENRPRVGADHRKGKDATPEMFTESFGFRGVEFGKWVTQGKNQAERQGMLDAAYDALMDLATILDVPPKALSLDGTLGLGLGSRGRGRASAHFEPDYLVINLTKTRGAGSLAHEWFHALDNYFQRKRGPKGIQHSDLFITHAPENYYQNKAKEDWRYPEARFEEMKEKGIIRDPENWKLVKGVRSEVGQSFAELVKTLNKSPMSRRAALIDKGKAGGYWSRTLEKAARSFENYTISKMQQKGYHNDYLANVVPADQFGLDPDRYPYQLAEEMPPIEEAFDNLFSVIETKETDKGVELFREPTAEALAEALPKASAADKLRIRNLVRKMLGAEVAKDLEFVDQVLRGAQPMVGSYSKGLIKIVDGQADPTDTAVHEAMHAAEDLLLTPNELETIDKAEPNAEKRANKFIEYVNSGQGVTGAIRRIFGRLLRRVKAFVKLTTDRDRLYELYDKIVGGQIAERGPIRAAAREGDAFRDQTDTPAFKKWFGDSKVVDESGEPEAVYHGTDAEFTEFKDEFIGQTDDGYFGRGFYFSNSQFTARQAGKNQIEVFLSIQNPFILDMDGDVMSQITGLPLSTADKDALLELEQVLEDADQAGDFGEGFENWAGSITKAAKKLGHDGVVIENRYDDYVEYVAFSPTQVKSATENIGTFDPAKPDIRYRPDRVFYVNPKGIGKVEIITNPTPADYRRTKEEVREEFPRDTGPTTRFTVDPDGNKYIWKAHRGLHNIIEPLIQNAIGAPVNQGGYFDDIQYREKPVPSADAGKGFLGNAQSWIQTFFGEQPKEKGVKKDIGWLANVVLTPLYKAEKNERYAKLFEAGRGMSDFKARLENDIFQDDLKYYSDLAKTDKAGFARVEQYLLEMDREAMGYTVKQNKDGQFEVYKPSGYKLKGFFKTEAAAWRAAVAGEVNDLITHKQFTQEQADAVAAWRRITNRTYDELSKFIGGVAKEMEAVGLDPTKIEADDGTTVDLFDALREMGDRRGHYFPRQRGGGRFQALAKKGDDVDMRIFDTPIGRRAWTSTMRHKGYAVTWKRTERPSEQAFLDLDLVAMNDMIQQALDSAEFSEERQIADLKDMGITSKKIEYKRKDGGVDDYFILTTPFKEAYNEVFKDFGGKYFEVQGEEGKAWHFKDPSQTLESDLANRLLRLKLEERTPVRLIAQALVNQIAKQVESRGSRAAKIGRLGATGEQVIRGYDEDSRRVISKYVKGVAGGTAKTNFAKQAQKIMTGTEESWAEYREANKPEGFDEMTGKEKQDALGSLWEDYRKLVSDRRIDSAKQPNLYEESTSFTRELLRNEEPAERIMGVAKGLAAMKYLTGIAPGVVNLTAMVTNVPAAMRAYANIPLRKGLRYVGEGMKIFSQGLAHETRGIGKGIADADMQAAYEEMRNRNYDEALFNREAMEQIQGKLGRGADTFMRIFMYPFAITERVNRGGTVMGIYSALRDQAGKTEFTPAERAKAIDEAIKITDKAHGLYGKVNRPKAVRGSGLGAQALQSAYTFKTYTHNYFQLLASIYEKKDHKALAYAILAPTLLGGAGAALPVTLVRAVFSAFGLDAPDQPEEKIYGWLRDTMGEPTEKLARQGIPSLAGFNLSGSLAVDIGAPRSFGEFLGAPYSVYKDLTQGAGSLMRGDALKGVERMLPRALGAPVKGYREWSEGVTTRTNQPVFYGEDRLKASNFEFLLRSLQFNPSNISYMRDRQWRDKRAAGAFSDRRTKLYAQMRRALLKNDTGALGRTINDMEAYNAGVRRQRNKAIPLITRRTIKSAVTRMRTPPRQEKIRAGLAERAEEESLLELEPEEVIEGRPTTRGRTRRTRGRGRGSSRR